MNPLTWLHFTTLTVIQFGIGAMAAGMILMLGLVLLFTLPRPKSQADLEAWEAIREHRRDLLNRATRWARWRRKVKP